MRRAIAAVLVAGMVGSPAGVPLAAVAQQGSAPLMTIHTNADRVLTNVDYIVYIDKPAPDELPVEPHGYDLSWRDPADGTLSARRKWSGQHFTGEPPDRYHDWVLRLVRETTLESMNRSYKFESRS